MTIVQGAREQAVDKEARFRTVIEADRAQHGHGPCSRHCSRTTIHDGVGFVNGGTYGGMYAFDADHGTQLWPATVTRSAIAHI